MPLLDVPESQPGLTLPILLSSLMLPNTCAVPHRLSLHRCPHKLSPSDWSPLPGMSPHFPCSSLPTQRKRTLQDPPQRTPLTPAQSPHVSFLATPRECRSSRPPRILCSLQLNSVCLTGLSVPRGQGPFLEPLLNSTAGTKTKVALQIQKVWLVYYIIVLFPF